MAENAWGNVAVSTNEAGNRFFACTSDAFFKVRVTGRSAEGITAVDVARCFGANSSEPGVWVLVEFVAAQKIHSTGMTKQAYLGGG